jgi:hypothetical protein
MRFPIGLAMIVCIGLIGPIAPLAHGGVIKAVVEKHKKKPDSLHAKVQANIKDKKAASGRHKHHKH